MERQIATARLKMEAPTGGAEIAGQVENSQGGELDSDGGAGAPDRRKRFDRQRVLEVSTVAQFSYNDAFTFAAWIRPETKNAAILSMARISLRAGAFCTVEGRLAACDLPLERPGDAVGQRSRSC